MINKKLLILAIVLSIITTGSVYFYLEQAKTGFGETVYESVVVATSDVPAKTIIDSDMLETIEVPMEYIHGNAVSSIDEVVGKITSESLYSGEQVLKNKIVNEGDSSKGLAYQIPEGKRAVSVHVNEVSGVAGLIRPGDNIDAIATLDLDGENVGRVVQSSYVLQNIEVLAVNRNMSDVGMNELGVEGQSTITLAVNPDEATPLVLASEKGSVRLLLRSHTDEEIKRVPAYRLSNFLKEGE